MLTTNSDVQNTADATGKKGGAKRPFVLIALLIVLLLGGVLAAWQFGLFGGQGGGTSASAQSWQEQYDLGVRYVEDGNYEEAIIAFTAAITIDPKQPEPYIALADVYIVLDDVDTAIAILAQGYTATGDDGIKEKQDALEAQQAADASEDDANEADEIIAEDDAAAEPDLNDPTVVTWNDTAMESLIRMALEKPDGDITQGELNGITELYIFGEYCDFYSDDGMSWANYDAGTLSDISDLAKLTNLNVLRIYINEVEDITPLVALNNLTELRLVYNNISDISPLAELTNLTSLHLSANNISDLTPLAELTNLTYLSFDFNNVSDLSPLAGLSNLTTVSANNNAITDWSPVAHVENVYGQS